MADIFPTHSCFDDAMELINEIIMQNPNDRNELLHNLILVHAICLMPEDNTPYAHAWVEDRRTNTCMFKGVLEGQSDFFAADKKEYYEEMKVQETTNYTVKEAALQNVQHGTLGPWKHHYKAFCRNFAP